MYYIKKSYVFIHYRIRAFMLFLKDDTDCKLEKCYNKIKAVLDTENSDVG